MEFITPRMHKYMYIVEKLQSYQFECQSYTENLQTIDNVLYSFSGKTILKLQYSLRLQTLEGVPSDGVGGSVGLVI